MPKATPEEQKEYQRQWLANRRATFFADKQCVACGSTDRLELDHIDPSQKTTHRIWSWSQARRDVEIAKCQVLCNVCHKGKTKQYMQAVRSYDNRELCDRGHPLALVGVYRKASGVCCRFCQHIANAALRGGRAKTLDEFARDYAKRK